MSSILSIKKPTLRQSLAAEGWTKSNQWGSPREWGRGSIFWELIINPKEYFGLRSIHYPRTIVVNFFPDTFDKYVVPFRDAHMAPAGHLMFTNGTASTRLGDWICPIEIKDIDDIHMAFAEYKRLLMKIFKQ